MGTVVRQILSKYYYFDRFCLFRTTEKMIQMKYGIEVYTEILFHCAKFGSDR